MSSETIVWKSTDAEMPDDGIDVLVKTPSPSYPVWIGSHDSDDGWTWCDGASVPYAVTHWAEIPEGPRKSGDLTGVSNGKASTIEPAKRR